MSHKLESRLHEALSARDDQQSRRRLPGGAPGVDFRSNDYLGLARSEVLRRRIAAVGSRRADALANGSSGSRLISGNDIPTEQLEARIAAYHHADTGLMFSTGYAANSGLFGCIVGAGDTLILDELIHASTIDGARLSKADKLIFSHNDPGDLEARLRLAKGNKVIGVESVYSMDGDEAPLAELINLAERYDAALIVDEAHSNGIAGPDGRGLVVARGFESRVFARVCTFGKALGLHGAIVLGSRTLRDYLINFARPFIYSTAPSPHTIDSITAVYQLLPELDATRQRLFDLVAYLRARVGRSSWRWLDSPSWIQSVVVPGNQLVRTVSMLLQEQGLSTVPIVAPTVAMGSERIRICLHAFNTRSEIDHLLEALEEAHTKCMGLSLRA